MFQGREEEGRGKCIRGGRKGRVSVSGGGRNEIINIGCTYLSEEWSCLF